MKIGLLGHGVVGSGVTSIIDAGRTEAVRNLKVTDILVKDQSEVTDERMTTNADDVLNADIDAVAECMGGLEPAHTFVKKALEKGHCAVTSNKKMLANYFEELMETAEKNHAVLLYEATAGGGIPWMANLRQIRRIDQIRSFRGIFNGTTNYILYHMDLEDRDFDEMLKEAQALGYAERDPSDDIDGFDVRYKVQISCASAFDMIVKPDEIPAFGIRYISAADIAWAKSKGKTAKLIGRAALTDNGLQAYVMPVFLNNSDYLSRIPSNLNGIESVSDTLGPAGFIGQGAGSLPTAHAVVQDLISISEGIGEHRHFEKTTVANSEVNGVYYIRTACPSVFEDIAGEVICEGTLITEKVSFDTVLDKIAQCGDEKLFIAEVAE